MEAASHTSRDLGRRRRHYLRVALLGPTWVRASAPHKAHGLKVYLTPYRDACAIDTTASGRALVSVPVFCGRLVERIAAESPSRWDTSTIDTEAQYLLSGPRGRDRRPRLKHGAESAVARPGRSSTPLKQEGKFVQWSRNFAASITYELRARRFGMPRS